jgi:hypothetical protein
MARKNPDKTVHFFTPSYPASSKEEYREEVEKGPKPFPPREEDERDLHIMIRGGRSAARYANVAESIGTLEDEASLARRATRWEDQLRPWDARTQSPAIRERMRPVSVEEIRDYILMSLGPGASPEEIAAAMEEAAQDIEFLGVRAPRARDEKVFRVRDAIARYMQRQNQTLGFSVPDTVDPLVAAGMPQDAAEILVRRAARRLFPTEDLVFVPEPPSVRAIIQRRFADLGRFRVTGTAMDPTFAFARGAQTTADIERIFVQDLRTRRSLGSVSEKQLSDLLGGRGRPFESILSGFYALVERMFEFAARQADPTALVFILRSRETGQQVVRSLSTREHSKFLQGQRTARRMDYRTLQNIPLSDLPRILVGISRKGRRRARSNPMPAERADAAILDTVVAAYNQNQLVDVPGQPGMVYWPIAKGRGKRHRFVGVKTTTRERAQSWIDLAVLRRQQAGDGVFPVTASQPLPAPALPVPEVAMRNSDEDYWFHQYGRAPFGAGRSIPTARRNPMKKNPWYESLYLPDTTEVRSALVPAPRGWHDDTEVRSALVPGPYGKKNPRRKKKKARRNSAAREAMRLHHEEGMSLKDAWKHVKRNPGVLGTSSLDVRKPGRIKFNSKKTKRNPRSRHNGAASEAMRLHHETGMSLKDAWAQVKRNPSYRPYSKFSARGLPQYEQIVGPFSTTQRATHGIQPSNRRNPGRRRSARMNPLTNSFNPNLHCCVTGQHIPIGAPMVVHPTMKGPRGGKRYCIPGAI